MKLYTLYISTWRPPVLIEDSFTWGGFLLGPLWLLYHRCIVAAALTGAALVLIVLLTQGFVTFVLVLALEFLIGLQGSDMRCWSLTERGFKRPMICAARDRDDALLKVLQRAPDLTEHFRAELR